MEPQINTKLYVLGSTQISQFSLPLPTNGSNQKPSHSRIPFCISKQPYFDVLQVGKQEDDETYKQIPNSILSEKIIAVACGGAHTLLLTDKHQVFTFGSNDEGSLGRIGEESIPLPVKLEFPIDMITAGDCHSVFGSTIENVIYFCGVYRGIVKGQLEQKIEIPQQITLHDIDSRKKPSKLRKVLSGFNHTMVLADQTIYIRGDVQYCALGRKFMERRKSQVKPSLWMAIGIKRVVDIWTGGMHCFAKALNIKKREEIYGWGNNSFGQLGLGRKGQQLVPEKIPFFADKQIVKIVGGEHHTIFLTSDGDVFSCGKNDVGQLGLGEDFQNDDSNEDSLLSYISTPQQIESLDNVKDIISGPHFSYAIRENEEEEGEQELYSWGLSGSYVLFNGSEKNDKYEPYKVLKRILNEEKIIQLSAGGQHVVYLAEESTKPVTVTNQIKTATQNTPVTPLPPPSQPTQASYPSQPPTAATTATAATGTTGATTTSTPVDTKLNTEAHDKAQTSPIVTQVITKTIYKEVETVTVIKNNVPSQPSSNVASKKIKK